MTLLIDYLRVAFDENLQSHESHRHRHNDITYLFGSMCAGPLYFRHDMMISIIEIANITMKLRLSCVLKALATWLDFGAPCQCAVILTFASYEEFSWSWTEADTISQLRWCDEVTHFHKQIVELLTGTISTHEMFIANGKPFLYVLESLPIKFTYNDIIQIVVITGDSDDSYAAVLNTIVNIMSNENDKLELLKAYKKMVSDGVANTRLDVFKISLIDSELFDEFDFDININTPVKVDRKRKYTKKQVKPQRWLRTSL